MKFKWQFRFALILAVQTTIVDAAPLRTYTPGGSPCNGVCTLPWAQAQFGVPDGVPEAMTIPAGAYVLKMSYGRDGKPYAMDDFAVLMTDEPGIGYWFNENGKWYLMARLDVCQNWAVFSMPEPNWYTDQYPKDVSSRYARPVSEPFPVYIPGGVPVIRAPDPVIPEVPPAPEVPEVPLPASALLLFGVMSALVVMKRISRR